MQETYARVLARPRILRRGGELPYLLRVLRNTYLTSLRTAARRPRTVELLDDESSALASAQSAPDVAVEHLELLAAVAALPTDFREALVAVDIVGLSYRQAARALGAREATITTRLHRARERVARTLAGESERDRDVTAEARIRARRETVDAGGRQNYGEAGDRNVPPARRGA